MNDLDFVFVFFVYFLQSHEKFDPGNSLNKNEFPFRIDEIKKIGSINQLINNDKIKNIRSSILIDLFAFSLLYMCVFEDCCLVIVVVVVDKDKENWRRKKNK